MSNLNDPFNIDTSGLEPHIAGAVAMIRNELKAAGNNSIAFAAASTLGELVGALLRLPKQS